MLIGQGTQYTLRACVAVWSVCSRVLLSACWPVGRLMPRTEGHFHLIGHYMECIPLVGCFRGRYHVTSHFTEQNKSKTRTTASVLKQDPNTQKVQKNAMY